MIQRMNEVNVREGGDNGASKDMLRSLPLEVKRQTGKERSNG